SLLRFFFYSCAALPHPPSFPTRRSSDLTSPRCPASSAIAASAIPPSPSCSWSRATAPAALRRAAAIASTRRSFRCAARSSTSSRSEEHTSELQSRENLVCRLLLEKKNEL